MGIFSKKLNILVLGSEGMLGHDVYQHFYLESLDKHSKIGKVVGLDALKGDLVEHEAMRMFMDYSVHFDYCINCIAYTDTSGAESGGYEEKFAESKRMLSYRLNAKLPYDVAMACKQHGTKLIHISTDYVFSEMNKCHGIAGTAGGLPVGIFPTPKSIYGTHKLLGEMFIKQVFGEKSKDYAILRTSWLFGMHNSKSFVHKFLLNALKCLRDGKKIEVTSNEHSVPTSTDFLVYCIGSCIENKKKHGILHAVPTVDYVGYGCGIGEKYGPSRLEFAKLVLKKLDAPLSMFPGFESDSRRTSSIDVEPIERHTYAPTSSGMLSSFMDERFSRSWEDDVSWFISRNKHKLKEWLVDELNKKS